MYPGRAELCNVPAAHEFRYTMRGSHDIAITISHEKQIPLLIVRPRIRRDYIYILFNTNSPHLVF